MTPPPPDRDTWRRLIGPALAVIDSLIPAGYGPLDFRLGGGTVLMLRFDHRISKDIDIFTHDAEALSFITPRLNDVANSIADSYEEHANVLKLLLPEGDIDFIVAAPVIPHARPRTMDLDGRTLALDATAEILAKKLLYRADSFKARDVFDMAVTFALDRPSALEALRATAPTRPALLARLAQMAKAAPNDLMAGIVPTETGLPHVQSMVPYLVEAITKLDGGT